MKTVILLTYVLLCIIAYWGLKDTRNSKKTVNISVFIMFLIAVFKDGSQMPDYNMYEVAYYQSINGTGLSSIEISYSILSRIFGNFGSSGFNLLLGFYSIIFLLAFREIINQSLQRGPLIVLILYSNAFLIFGLIQIRAGAAIAVIYMILLSNRDRFKNIILWFIAIFLHVTSIVFLPLMSLRNKVLSKSAILLMLLFTICLIPFFIEILNVLSDIIPITYIKKKIVTYTIEQRADGLRLNFLGLNFILRSLFLVLFFRYKKIYKTQQDRMLFIMYFIGYLAYIGLSSTPEIAFRIANSLFISEVFLLTTLISKLGKKNLQYLITVTYSSAQLILNIMYTTYFNYN